MEIKLDDVRAFLTTADSLDLIAIKSNCISILSQRHWFDPMDDDLDTDTILPDDIEAEDSEAELSLIEYFDNHEEDEFDDTDKDYDEDLEVES